MYRLELLLDDSVREFYDTHFNDFPENAGIDLFVSEDTQVGSSVVLLNHGLKARMVNLTTGRDSHYWLVPRSSIFKSNIVMANSIGVIDRTYRGYIKAPVQSTENKYGSTVEQSIKRGQRLFQIVAPDMGDITEVILVNSLPESSRGAGGFGSTGS